MTENDFSQVALRRAGYQGVEATDFFRWDRDELAEWHPSAAVRWKPYFYGVGREPLFTFRAEGEVDAFYPIVNQPGLELQLTGRVNLVWRL